MSDDERMKTDDTPINVAQTSTKTLQDVRVTDAARHGIPSGSEVAAASFKLQPLWTNNAHNWFKLAELQFETQQIKSDRTKFTYILNALTPETCNIISDFMDRPPNVNQYTAIKQLLIDRLAPSDEAKLQQLLSGQQIGDGKPSEVLRRIRSLANQTMGNTAIRSIWTKNLPEIIRISIASHAQDVALDDLSRMADRMYEAMPKEQNSVSAVSHMSRPPQRHRENNNHNNTANRTESYESLQERVAWLEERFNKRTPRNRPQQRRFHSPSPNRYQSNSYNRYSRDRTLPRNEASPRRGYWLCKNHFKYRERTKNCIPPCSWNRGQPTAPTTENRNVGDSINPKNE